MVLILSENVFISVNWLFLADVPINSNSSSTTRSARTKRQGTKSVSYVPVRVRLFIADAYLLQPRSPGQVLPLRVPLGFSLELVLNVSCFTRSAVFPSKIGAPVFGARRPTKTSLDTQRSN